MKIFLITLSAFFLVQCSSHPTQDKENSKTQTKNSSWAKKMNSTANAFKDILPLIYNEKEFKAPVNKQKVGKKISTFAGSIHDLPKDQARKFIGDDPFLLSSISQLKNVAKRADVAFKEGRTSHSIHLLKRASAHCFKCHTRMPHGPDSLYWKDLNISQIQTSPLEKSQLYVSMRQYDDAKMEISSYLNSLEHMNKFNIDFENGLKYYLVIALRGQNSVKNAMQVVESKLNSKVVNPHFKNVLRSWKKDLSYWNQKEKNTSPSLNSAKMILKRGGESMKTQFYSDENFVKRLIASSLIHQSLNEPKLSKATKAESYFYLGSIYDSLIVASYWDLPELYYEMCIKYQPSTTIAQKCYNKMADSITVGYSGSRGTFIPDEEKRRLERLKKMAF